MKKYTVHLSTRVTIDAEIVADSKEQAEEIAKKASMNGELGSLDDWEFADDDYYVIGEGTDVDIAKELEGYIDLED